MDSLLSTFHFPLSSFGLPSLNISPQGLVKLLNQSAVYFLMRMFAKSLSLSIDKDEKLVPLLNRFAKVHLLDSSYITLPEDVAKLLPAPGGSASKAGAKIQLMIDYKSGNFSHLWLTDALTPDQTQMHIAQSHIDKGELLIHDPVRNRDCIYPVREYSKSF